MTTPKVVIIGAGAAGIAAASKLVESSLCDVTILEAENRIGGRIFTTKFGENILELGAQWVHGEKNNVAYSLGSSAGLLNNNQVEEGESRYFFSDGSIIKNEIAEKLYKTFNEVVEDKQTLSKFKGSLGDYFIKSIKGKLKDRGIEIENNMFESFSEWFHSVVNGSYASDSWFETSAAGCVEYKDCEGNYATRWKTGGYHSIFKLLMGNNRSKVQEKIIFNKTVRKISWGQHPLEIICSDGQKFTADHVLSTVSLGVLKENCSTLFEPSLPPKKINAIQALSFGTVDKIFLKFPHRWWPVDCEGFCFLWRKDDILSDTEEDWIKGVSGFHSVDNHPLVFCIWMVGPTARQMEQRSDQQVKDGCYQLLLRFLGSHYNIPPPDSIIRSQWYVNPNFRGSYSCRSVTSDKYDAWASDLATPLLHSGNPVLLFAGEATHDHYFSTVHGAIESGWREAERLITHLSSSTKNRSSNTH